MVKLAECNAIGRHVLVDNVAVSGGTALAAAEALGSSCVVLVWAWDSRSAAELAAVKRRILR